MSEPQNRQPRFVPPPGAWDCHCHVYAPGPRFPAHHGEQLFALHRRLGIEHAVIVQADRHSRAVTMEALAASGGRYRGVAVLDADTSDDELTQLHAAGIRGARFTFTAHLGGAPDLDVVRRTAERIAPMGWHLAFLLDPADMLAHLDFFRSIPLPFVFDHLGRTDITAGIDSPDFTAVLELAKQENFWIKVSGADRISVTGAPFHDALPFARALIAAAPDRVLWGTDWPHPNNRFEPDVADLVDLLPLIAPDAATRQKLLVANPARLYGFAS